MPRGSKKRENATREIRNTKQRIKNALLKKVRKEWTVSQAVDDIDRQLRSKGFAPIPVDTPNPPQHPAQKRLIEALTAPAEPTLEGQYKRKNRAINAAIAYCFIEEGPTPRRTATVVTKPTKRLEEPAVDSPRYAALLSVFVTNEKERPRSCFVCVGIAISLERDDPRIEKLIREFSSSSDLTKHFRRRHLSNLQESDKVECRAYMILLEHKIHFQNHALQIHSTFS